MDTEQPSPASGAGRSFDVFPIRAFSMNDPLAHALEFLPHGAEFRFVDRVTRLDAGTDGQGEYDVRGDEPFLRGHFPGEPLFPGVLLTEAAAQLAGVVAQSDPRIPPMSDLKLTGIRGVKFFDTARPGETIRIEARIDRRVGHLIHAEVAAYVGSRRLMIGEVILGGGGSLQD